MISNDEIQRCANALANATKMIETQDTESEQFINNLLSFGFKYVGGSTGYILSWFASGSYSLFGHSLGKQLGVLYKVAIDTSSEKPYIEFIQTPVNDSGIEGITETEDDNVIYCSHLNFDEIVTLCKLFGYKV